MSLIDGKIFKEERWGPFGIFTRHVLRSYPRCRFCDDDHPPVSSGIEHGFKQHRY